MGLFQEYLDSKGKIAKPVVDASGDNVDPKTPPVNPPESKSPYIGKGYNIKNQKTGLADPCHCNNDLVYKPSDDSKSSEHPPAKIPTAEQAEIISLVADAIKRDPTVVEQFIYQMRQEGLFAPLVAEMLQYKESYKHIAEVMGHKTYGPPVCHKLARAMNEEIAPPMHASLDQEDELEAPELKEPEQKDEEDFEFGDNSPPEPEMEGDVDITDNAPEAENSPEPEMTPAMQNFRRALMSRF